MSELDNLNRRCRHIPEYDEAVNETYCAMCLERLPNVPRPAMKHTWWDEWMDQPVWQRTLAYLGAGYVLAKIVGWVFD